MSSRAMAALLLLPQRAERAAPSRYDEAVERGLIIGLEPEIAGA